MTTDAPAHVVATAGDRRALCGTKDPTPVVLITHVAAHVAGHGMIVCPDCARTEPMKVITTKRPRLSDRERMLRTVTERQWQTQVEEILQLHGWAIYHTHDSRRSHGGFPDLIAIRERDGDILAAELKTQTGIVKPDQLLWLGLFSRAGVDTYVWRPEHVDDVIARAKWPDLVEAT